MRTDKQEKTAIDNAQGRTKYWLAFCQWLENHNDTLNSITECEHLEAIAAYKDEDLSFNEKYDGGQFYYGVFEKLITHKVIALLANPKYFEIYKKWLDSLPWYSDLREQLILLVLKSRGIFPELSTAVENDLKKSGSKIDILLCLFKLKSLSPLVTIYNNVTNIEISLLLCAASDGALDVVQWLIKRGYRDKSEKDIYGNSALLWAAKNCHLDLVKWLLEQGHADKGEKNNNGWTALLWAVINGHIEVVQWLLENGYSNIDEKDDDNRSALLWAAACGHITIAQCLLEHGYTDINGKDNGGMTALLGAAHNDHLALVQKLLAKAARIDETDNEGKSALDHAQGKTKYWLALYQWLEDHKDALSTLNDCEHVELIKDYKEKDASELYYAALETLISHKATALLANPNYYEVYKIWLESLTPAHQRQLIILVQSIEGIVSEGLPIINGERLLEVKETNFSKMLLTLFKENLSSPLITYHPSQLQKETMVVAQQRPLTMVRDEKSTEKAENITAFSVTAFESQEISVNVAAFETIKHQIQQNHIKRDETKTDTPLKKISEIESFIKKVWGESLGLSEFSDDTKKFTEFEGKVAQWQVVLKRLEQRYLISMQDTHYNATIMELVRIVNEKLRESDSLIRYHVHSDNVASTKKQAGLFLIHPIMGGIDELKILSKKIDKTILEKNNLSLYIWRSPLLKMDFDSADFESEYASLCTMSRQAELAVAGIKAVQPHGPYYLSGWSYGGPLTIEIARQLQGQGEKVKYIGLIDPQTPEQLRLLSPVELRKRLLMHINYISGLLLRPQVKDEFIKEHALEIDKKEIELILYAFEVAFNTLENYQNHSAFSKLKAILYTLKANYLAIYGYHPEALLKDENKLLAVTVYVASDKPDILDKKEYHLHDFASIAKVKLAEPVVKDTNHFDIVLKEQFANLLMKHINNINEIKLTNKFWQHLERHYQTLDFTHLQFLYDDIPFKVMNCKFHITSSNQNQEPIEKLFDKTSKIRHVLLNGKPGIGKTTSAHQLTLKNLSYQIWFQKKWVFYIPLQRVYAYIQAQEYPLSDNDTAIQTLLYHHFFKLAGISYEQVAAFWNFIKKEPEAICFILDGVDEVIDETALSGLWQELFMHEIAVIAVTRNYYINQLKVLGFSPSMKFTVEEFNDLDYVQEFITQYYQQLNERKQGDELWQWLTQFPAIQAFCKTPFHLTMVCSIWSYLNHELSKQKEIKLTDLFSLCVKNMFRRYLHRSSLATLLELNTLTEFAIEQQTVQVAQFLELCAFESMKANWLPRISAKQMNQWLTQFNGEKDFFKKVLISGFLYPVGYAQFDIDRCFQFNSQAIQLYFACQYVRHHFFQNSNRDKSLQTEQAKTLGNFIHNAIKQFNFDLVKEFMVEPLKEAKDSQVFIELLTLLNHQVPEYYEINTLKFIIYCCEASYQAEENQQTQQIRQQLIEKLGNVFYCFTSEFSKSYELNEQKNNPDLDSLPLRIYKREIEDLNKHLKHYYPQLFVAFNDEKFKYQYHGNEGVLHYAILKQDESLTEFLLKLRANTELRNDESNRPIDLAFKNHFKKGVELISKYRLERIYEQLYDHWLDNNHENIKMESCHRMNVIHWRPVMMQALQEVIHDVVKGKGEQSDFDEFIHKKRATVRQGYIDRWRVQEQSKEIIKLNDYISHMLETYGNPEEKNNSVEEKANYFEVHAHINQQIVNAYLKNTQIMQNAILYLIETKRNVFLKDKLYVYFAQNKQSFHSKYEPLYKTMLVILEKAKRSAWVEQDCYWALDEIIQQWFARKIEEQSVITSLQAFIRQAVETTICSDKKVAFTIFDGNKTLILKYLFEQYRCAELGKMDLAKGLAGLVELVCEKCYGSSINEETVMQILQDWSAGEVRHSMQIELENRLFKKVAKQKKDESAVINDDIRAPVWLKTPSASSSPASTFFAAIASDNNNIPPNSDEDEGKMENDEIRSKIDSS